ncbi:MAG: radical SAM protein [Deltaproteobacteria bacterium]|nr:radical SAM protein [Deltaproteobacteria bacterium]
MHGKSYDIIGLSVLEAIREDDPLKDAVWLKKRFGPKVVVGGKWTQTITDEEKAFLERNGIDICTEEGETYFEDHDIDIHNYPSWSRIDFETLGETHIEIMSTRGCPHHCYFCHNTEKHLSFFSASRTADNIELLFNLGKDQLFIVDDIFTLKPSHMEELYVELKRRNIQIENRNSFFTHVKHINDETLYWMKKYKPLEIQIGIQSGDDRMLKAMGNLFKSEDALRKIELLNNSGLTVRPLFMIGFPGEDTESLKNTLDFIRRLRPLGIFYRETHTLGHKGLWVGYYQAVRGTKGYQMAIERDPKLQRGKRNIEITYVDPNLSKKILFAYRSLMMKGDSENNFVSRCKDTFIQRSPHWLTNLMLSLKIDLDRIFYGKNIF